MRVLLIEDDGMLGKALVRGLSESGMSVDWTRDGADGFAALERSEYAVVLIDIGVPTMTGLEVLQAKRATGSSTPALIITARDGVSDMVAGLGLGADDYIVKPFELPVLLARMRAVMRRAGGRAVPMMTSAEISLDPATQIARYRDVEDVLSAREFAVLNALMERPGQILSRSHIENRIYGWGEEVQSNAVDVVIHGLRRKFGKDVVRNVRGVGWLVTKEKQ